MKATGYRSATFVALWMVRGLLAAGAEPAAPGISSRMPACAELEKASAAGLVGYLEKDRKGLANHCVNLRSGNWTQ